MKIKCRRDEISAARDSSLTILIQKAKTTATAIYQRFHVFHDRSIGRSFLPCFRWKIETRFDEPVSEGKTKRGGTIPAIWESIGTVSIYIRYGYSIDAPRD